jgi:alpha-beta hydrolase superfamily lysophospholipase
MSTIAALDHRAATPSARYAGGVSIFDRDELNDRLFFPRPDAGRPPPGARDHRIDVGGARLHVRVHAGPPGAPVLLLFHGNGEVVADYDDAAARFADAGAALAVVDYRGYGASTGTPTLRGLIADARRVAEVLQPRIVMGRSLGGVAAHELYARPTAGLAGVVLESALFDLAALVRRRGLVPPDRFSDDERRVFEPAGKLALGHLPLLVLHGERDELIVPDEARAALAAAGAAEAEKTLAIIPGRGHNDVSLGDGYWAALAGFIARVAARPGPA